MKSLVDDSTKKSSDNRQISQVGSDTSDDKSDVVSADLIPKSSIPSEEDTGNNISDEELTAVTLEADKVATSYLGSLLLPLVVIMSLRSLVVDKHAGWYSWGIGKNRSFFPLANLLELTMS